jgi:hypothetical protein
MVSWKKSFFIQHSSSSGRCKTFNVRAFLFNIAQAVAGVKRSMSCLKVLVSQFNPDPYTDMDPNQNTGLNKAAPKVPNLRFFLKSSPEKLKKDSFT